MPRCLPFSMIVWSGRYYHVTDAPPKLTATERKFCIFARKSNDRVYAQARALMPLLEDQLVSPGRASSFCTNSSELNVGYETINPSSIVGTLLYREPRPGYEQIDRAEKKDSYVCHGSGLRLD